MATFSRMGSVSTGLAVSLFLLGAVGLGAKERRPPNTTAITTAYPDYKRDKLTDGR